jgi:hypothetical protein
VAVNELVTQFVEGKVSKVSKNLVHVLFRRFLVLLSAKPDHGFICNESYQRINRGDEHIDTEVELLILNEQWRVKILLHDIVLLECVVRDLLKTMIKVVYYY